MCSDHTSRSRHIITPVRRNSELKSPAVTHLQIARIVGSGLFFVDQTKRTPPRSDVGGLSAYQMANQHPQFLTAMADLADVALDDLHPCTGQPYARHDPNDNFDDLRMNHSN
jgi:hypothetical protein